MKNALKVILLIDTARAYERGLIRGIAKYSALFGPWIFYRQTPFYRFTQENKNTLKRLKSWNADGIIMRENRMMKDILTLGLPTVVFPYSSQEIENTTVITDDEAIGKQGAAYLLNKGYQHFAFCGFEEQYWSVKRKKYFENEINSAGKNFYPYINPTSLREKLWENEPFYMASWLYKLPKPLAIMTANDERGQQVIEAAKIAELQVPEQLAILGVDNDELVCELTNPALSSIDINPKKAGYEAGHILHKKINGEKVQKTNVIIRPHSVVTRQSTDIIAIEDENIRNALNYIRKNATHRALSIEEVVQSTTLSRRTLENKFARYLKRSILSEIKRIRIWQISKLLTDTNLTISEIAFDTGFLSVQNISRYFKNQTGYTPKEYRKKNAMV
jgi:LacI family transcriptional regulator